VRHYMMSLSACLDYVRRIRWIERNLMGDADVPPQETRARHVGMG